MYGNNFLFLSSLINKNFVPGWFVVRWFRQPPHGGSNVLLKAVEENNFTLNNQID
jgi:hypothetical protein